MAKFELKLPKMGESVAEATITNWLKEVGDHIDIVEAVFEIATDIVDSLTRKYRKPQKQRKKDSRLPRKPLPPIIPTAPDSILL